MKRLAVAVVVTLVVGSQCVFAQSQTKVLAADLTKEEQLLSPTATITQTDVARLKSLTEQIRAAKDPQLLSRAELMLVLFQERLKTKASVAAFNQAINREARSVRRDKWHRTKHGIVKTSFWIGMSSLGVIGISQSLSSWATDKYLQSSTLTGATPYFITGKISQLVSFAGIVGALGGLGTAWLLEVNPFDIPSARTTVSPVSFPKSTMTTAEKISYLEAARKDYARREKRASSTRGVSFAFLAAGLTGVLATGISGYLGNLAYNKYVNSTTAADATNYRNMVDLYQTITIGTASLALVGLGGATIGYLFGPDPSMLASSIRALDDQLSLLRQNQ